MTQTAAEYAALDFDGTERRANYRTVAYRIDILHLCERKDAAAILYEIIYRWQTEVRKPEVLKEVERRKKANLAPLTSEEVESMMWVWMSYNDFVRESGEAVAYNTVIRMLDYLVETAQILECRENHDPRYPDYEYRIRMDVVKKKLKALPAAPAFLPKVPKKKGKEGEGSTQVGTPEKRSTQKGRRAQVSTQVGIGSTQKGIATTQDGREVYPDGGTSHTSHIEHTEESTYGNIAHRELPTHAPSQKFMYSLDQGLKQPWEQDEPYRPDFSASQEQQGDTNGSDGHSDSVSGSHSDSNYHGGMDTQQPAVGNPQRIAPAQQQAGRLQVSDGHSQLTAHGITRQEAQAVASQSLPPQAGGYEKPAELSTLLGSSPQASAKVEPREKRTRTPRVPKVDPKDIELYRRVFDDCYREATGDESQGYAHTKASDKCIDELLQSNLSRPKFVTPAKLHAVYVRLWNLPKDPKSGFHWQEHMSIKAVCKNYEEHAMVLTAAARLKQQQETATEDDLKRQALARSQSGEMLGGMYRYVPPAAQPLHYLTADERTAIFGGK